MNDLTKLREATDKVLHGLNADESLKHRILQRAAAEDNKRQHVFRALPAFCSVVAVLLVAVAALNGLQPVSPAGSVEMYVFAAGEKETIPPEKESSPLPEGFDPEDVISIELSGVGIIRDSVHCTALTRTLMNGSQKTEPFTASGDVLLQITTSSGNVYRFETDEPYLSGEAYWTCPGFFTLFHRLLDQ